MTSISSFCNCFEVKKIIPLLALALCLLVSPAYAYSCSGFPSEYNFLTKEVVFVGKFKSAELYEKGPYVDTYKIVFEVEDVLKGNPGQFVEIYYFVGRRWLQDDRYLIFSTLDKSTESLYKGKYTMSPCSGLKDEKDLDAELAKIKNFERFAAGEIGSVFGGYDNLLNLRFGIKKIGDNQYEYSEYNERDELGLVRRIYSDGSIEDVRGKQSDRYRHEIEEIHGNKYLPGAGDCLVIALFVLCVSWHRKLIRDNLLSRRARVCVVTLVIIAIYVLMFLFWEKNISHFHYLNLLFSL